MPHDRQGRPIAVGDVIRFRPFGHVEDRAGVVTKVTPASATCNIEVGVAVQTTTVTTCLTTASEVELVARADGSAAA